MNLDEYLWRNKITVREMAKKINVSEQTLSLIKREKVSASLDFALKIHEITDGKVTLFETLTPDKQKKLSEWKKNSLKKKDSF